MAYAEKVILFVVSVTLCSELFIPDKTYAFEGAVSQAAVNRFESVRDYVSSDIEEPNGDQYEITDGKVTDKLIMFKNTGTKPMYVRVLISICVKDTVTGEIINKPVIVNSDTKEGCASVQFAINEENGWKQAGDGFFYYSEPVAPGGKTPQLLKGPEGGEITIQGLERDEYISFIVFSETYQEAFYD